MTPTEIIEIVDRVTPNAHATEDKLRWLAALEAQIRLELRELNTAVRGFLKQLPETERELFLSRYWFLLPVKEIAARFGFSANKVSTSLHRTRRKLQSYLKEEGLC